MTDKPFLLISGSAYKRLSPAERLAYDIAYEDAREAKKRAEREAYAASPDGRLDALEERVAALEVLLKKGDAS